MRYPSGDTLGAASGAHVVAPVHCSSSGTTSMTQMSPTSLRQVK